MDTYALHLGVAALLGASLVAVSAYYIHCETLTQLLEYLNFEDTVGREKANEELGRGESPQHFKKYGDKRRSHGRRRYRRASNWLADNTAISGAVDGGERRNDPVSSGRVPAGLPMRHTVPEGMQMSDFSPDDDRDLN